MVLDIAVHTAELVRKFGIEVVLTRNHDGFVSLQRRVDVANEQHADLFLSIHANSSPRTATSGPETYFLNFNANPSAMEVAARENAGSERGINALQSLIQAISLNARITESEAFAQTIQRSVNQQAGRYRIDHGGNGNALPGSGFDRGTKRAPFLVLTGTAMPSALVEVGFLSNTQDEYNLSQQDYRNKIAEALCEGIWKYAVSLTRFEIPRVSAKFVVQGRPAAKKRSQARQSSSRRIQTDYVSVVHHKPNLPNSGDVIERVAVSGNEIRLHPGTD